MIFHLEGAGFGQALGVGDHPVHPSVPDDQPVRAAVGENFGPELFGLGNIGDIHALLGAFLAAELAGAAAPAIADVVLQGTAGTSPRLFSGFILIVAGC